MRYLIRLILRSRVVREELDRSISGYFYARNRNNRVFQKAFSESMQDYLDREESALKR